MTSAPQIFEKGPYTFRRICGSEGKAIKTSFSLNDSVSIDFTLVPSGSFVMGSSEDESYVRANEMPAHNVSVSEFWIGTYPVTNIQWNAVADDLSLKYPSDSRPVVNVWLEQALNFCGDLSGKLGVEVVLPTEAQWEYACRGGTSTPYAFGGEIVPEVVNFGGLSGPWEVGTGGIANDFGLYDMHGCIWEWCSDVWHPNYNGAPSNGYSWDSDGD